MITKNQLITVSARIRKTAILWAGLGIALATSAWAGTATFAPVGPTTVPSGTNVAFKITVAADALSGIDAADIVIGANGVTDLSFNYDSAWMGAFDNVSTQYPDVGFYDQSIYVGGNNPSPVGTSVILGTVTVYTLGMPSGAYEVRIDPGRDTGISAVFLDGIRDPLIGVAPFTIQCAALDSDCDADVDLTDFAAIRSCATGPELTPTAGCVRFDVDSDGDIDLWDVRAGFNSFTGPH